MRNCACGHVARAFAHRTSGGVHRARVATLLLASRKSLGLSCDASGRPFDFGRDGQRELRGARAGGLVVQLLKFINRRRALDDDPKSLSAAEAEERLFM
eukprot:6184231-Pleurochrysis_carterae.AAC.1